jgi:hypothetical protein
MVGKMRTAQPGTRNELRCAWFMCFAARSGPCRRGRRPEPGNLGSEATGGHVANARAVLEAAIG